MSLGFPSKTVWLASHPVDFRKSIDGLCVISVNTLARNPSQEIIIFYNKRRDRLKILLWDDGGFVMIYKKLDKRKFIIPKDITTEKHLISQQELCWLLQGVDWVFEREKDRRTYSVFY